MYCAVHLHFSSSTQNRSVEDGGTGRNKHLLFQCGSRDVRVGADQAVIANAAGMFAAASNHSILHHNALVPDADRSTGLADNPGAMQDPSSRTDLYIPANRRIRRDPGIGMNFGTNPGMLNDHVVVLLSSP
jgi:hypothetical protein